MQTISDSKDNFQIYPKQTKSKSACPPRLPSSSQEPTWRVLKYVIPTCLLPLCHSFPRKCDSRMTAKNTLHVAFIHNSVDTGINNTQAEHNFGLRFMCEDNVLIMKTKTMIVKLDHINFKCRKSVGQKKTRWKLAGNRAEFEFIMIIFAAIFTKSQRLMGQERLSPVMDDRHSTSWKRKQRSFTFLLA